MLGSLKGGDGEEKGLSSDENGEVAIYIDRGTFDSFEGWRAHEVLTFEDGSTQRIKSQGIAKPGEEGKILFFEGTFEYIKGTGRFEGIKGSGSLTGEGFLAFGVGYMDFSGSYTVLSG